MRVLILGGDGALGHQLVRSWSERHHVSATVRRADSPLTTAVWASRCQVFDGVEAADIARVDAVLDASAPDAVVNAIGLVKQRPSGRDTRSCLEVNALFPLRLLELCAARRVRLVQMSTDCVFTGRTGGYTERDPVDAQDAYGLSKYLGELRDAPAVTLRTSFIGLELGSRQGLVEWFLNQRGTIPAFTRAIYTGLTSLELARVIERVLVSHADLYGLWHVASAPISKRDLLAGLAQALGRSDIELAPQEEPACDRSLESRAFEQRTGYRAPAWPIMLAELAEQIRTRERADAREATA